MKDFPVQYDDILKRIEAVNPDAYAKTRNYLDGAVTYLSPYISRGVISTKQVYQAQLNKGYPKKQVEKLLQELAWREYFQRVWQAKGHLIETDLQQVQTGVLHNRIPEAIVEAETGIAAIDTAIRQLYATGYMHNHVRMYVAAVTCNIASAHWLQPAKWLYYHLLDGDTASNNCSWQWVAGSFSSKKYYCNQENINRFTGSGQQHTFLDRPYDELVTGIIPDPLLTTTDIVLETNLPRTALPVIDDEKPTLIYNAYNLDPLWRKDEQVNRVLLLEPSHFKNHPASEKVISFITGLSGNINNIQLYCGEWDHLQLLYKEKQRADFIFKEHPAFDHYSGMADERSWIFPQVNGYFPSFSSYWKQCCVYLRG